MKKIPFQNRIIALCLSILFAIGLFLSLFSLPVEVVFFNPHSYSAVLEKEYYSEVLPNIISETLVFQASLSSQTNEINLVRDKDKIISILSKRISTELIQSSFQDVTQQILAYLNFKIPLSDMKVDIMNIKAELIADSGKITVDYLSTLPNCLASEMSQVDFNADITANDLPLCKPSGSKLAQFEQIWTSGFEDTFNSLPSSISVRSFLPLQDTFTNRNFYNYSLARWGIRLLPIVTILLLILIAVLLRNQRDVMLKWSGRLLLTISGITLVGLVVLLIGFDQFVAMVLNPYLNGFISGFGFVVLGVMQDLGFQTLIWVLISTLTLMAIGFFLLLAGRFSKPELRDDQTEEQELIGDEEWTESPAVEVEPEKAIVPETLEEIEEEEKELKKKNKKKDS